MRSELDRVLRRCLDEIEAGESPEACLERYAEHAADLAPILAAVGSLTALRGERLPQAARAQAHTRLRQAAVRRPAPPAPIMGRLHGVPVFARALAATCAAVLLLVLAGRVTLASQPGDLAYPIRVQVERLPAWLTPAGGERALVELQIADRRLDDVQAAARAPHMPEAAALEALLAGDAAAARQAAVASAAIRGEVVGRIRAHARVLTELSLTEPDPQRAQPLQSASQRADRLADELDMQQPRLPRGKPVQPGGQGGPSETPPANEAPERNTPADGRGGAATLGPATRPAGSSPGPGRAGTPAETLTPTRARHQATETVEPRASITPHLRAVTPAQTPQPSRTPAGTRPTDAPAASATPGPDGRGTPGGPAAPGSDGGTGPGGPGSDGGSGSGGGGAGSDEGGTGSGGGGTGSGGGAGSGSGTGTGDTGTGSGGDTGSGTGSGSGGGTGAGGRTG